MPEESTKDPQLLDLLAYKLPPKLGEKEREQLSRNMLLRALEQRTTIAFLGAGVSAPFGYPTWKQLSERVFKFTLEKLQPGKKESDPRIDACYKYIQILQARADRLGEEPGAAALMF